MAFKVTSNGQFTLLYSFDSLGGNSSLALGSDGNFYGTTYYGGNNGFGAIFQITPDGNLATEYSFGGTSGCRPGAAPMQHTSGLHYGDTSGCGADGFGSWAV